jgi:hypothetical protein
MFGPIIEFFPLPEEPDSSHCMMIGTIPTGISVPLHSHPDTGVSFWLNQD